VRFVGRRGRQALATYYGACDAFATTPWYEPFGITPLEAMACGRPVIGAGVGGIRFTVSDERTGFLVPPRDPVALAERLAILHKDRLLAGRMGAAGLARARRHFTWKRVARSVLESYRCAISPWRERPTALRARGFR
jgi:glycosyltransferase involved in cell wall biosynthesis